MELLRFEQTHVSAAAEIERLCFSDPWSEEGLRLLCSPLGAAYVVAEEGRVAAYAGMLTVLDEGQIVNVATHPDYRRRGFARAALGALISHAESEGIVLLSLEVRASNSAAISLYRSEGFVAAGSRPRFYSHPVEAALVMIRQGRAGISPIGLKNIKQTWRGGEI